MFKMFKWTKEKEWNYSFREDKGYQKAYTKGERLLIQLNKIINLLPTEFSLLLVTESYNDMACHWRTVRLRKVNSKFDNHVDFNLYYEGYEPPIAEYVALLNYAEKCNEEKQMKMIEPVNGLRIYYNENEKGAHYINIPTVKMMFGKTEGQICDRIAFAEQYAVLFHQFLCRIKIETPAESYVVKENKQMTREDARKIIFSKVTALEGKECQNIIETLEALGLIKFDEPVKPKYVFFPNPNGRDKDNVSVHLEDAIKTLREYGYIVKKAD